MDPSAGKEVAAYESVFRVGSGAAPEEDYDLIEDAVYAETCFCGDSHVGWTESCAADEVLSTRRHC